MNAELMGVQQPDLVSPGSIAGALVSHIGEKVLTTKEFYERSYPRGVAALIVAA
jgi:hypothetical protein